MSKIEEKTTLGMPAEIEAALTYLLGFFTGILFMLIEKDSKFVRFHAIQSTIFFGGAFVINIVVNIIPILGQLASLLISIFLVVMWILLMVKALQGKYYYAPFVKSFVEKYNTDITKP